jgi:hypothetical protein
VAALTPAVVVSFVLQIGLLALAEFSPVVRPERIQKVVRILIGVIAPLCTLFGLALYPVALRTNPLWIATGLVGLALLSPLAGLVESRVRKNGQAVYSTGVAPGTPNRLPGHLITNVLGALAAAGLVWVAHSTNGFNVFIAAFADGAAFNIMLPLATVVIFAFARWQQVDTCPDIDERATREAAHEDLITGSSLRHWHQFLNVLYLIVATFAATTAILCLLAYAMEQSKAGRPLILSWQVVVGIVVSLLFVYACGGPWARDNRAVYLTFLTGVPVALCAVLIWLSWLREDAARNFTALAVVGVGYVAYCIMVVLNSRNRGEKVHLHYFTTAGIALILAVLLGAMYAS